MKVTGIILAAGNSTRFGQGSNKTLFKLNGKAVIENSLNVFNNSECIDDIILVVKDEERNYFDDIIKRLALKKQVKYVKGGNSRKASVYNALKATECDYVVIHDGARPNVKEEYIAKGIEELGNFKGVTVAVRSKDTIKICDDNQVVQETTNRKNTWIIQTPQCFDKKLLKSLHERFDENDEHITDDCMILEECGYKIKIIEGDYTNIKLTTYDDINFLK